MALPFGPVDEWEKYEGMLVTITQSLSIGEYFNFDRFNETVLTDGRQYQPTAVHEPGSPEAAALAESNARRRITLDDGRNSQYPDPAIHPNGGIFELGNRFRGGDTVANVTGVLDFAFGLYRIQPTEGADYSVVNPRSDGPEDVGGNLTVGSFNVLNYFTTLDGRGANTPEEFQRQRTKIIATITELDADVVGLIEIENNDAAIADLVAGLNGASGAGTYAYIDTGVIGTDEIKVAFVYKPARVTPVGDYAILDASVDPRFNDTLNRPALAQTFRSNESAGVFTAVVNHLKSKGSDCNAVGDPDTGDGSGNCNLTRASAAEALVDWLATDPTGSGDDDFLIIGDLNSYAKEDSDRRPAGRRVHRPRARVRGRVGLLVRVRRPARIPRLRARGRGARRRGHGRDGVAHQRRRAGPARLRHDVQAACPGRAVRAERIPFIRPRRGPRGHRLVRGDRPDDRRVAVARQPMGRRSTST